MCHTSSVRVALPTNARTTEKTRQKTHKARAEANAVKEEKHTFEHTGDYATDSDLSDHDHTKCHRAERTSDRIPIDIDQVARTQKGNTPHERNSPST